MYLLLPVNIFGKVKLTSNLVFTETLQLGMNRLSTKLLQLHDLFAATVNSSLELEQKLLKVNLK